MILTFAFPLRPAIPQVFHICHRSGRRDSFLCPNGTVFNQKYFVCDWWYNFKCEDAPFFYPVNAAIGHPGVPLHKVGSV